MKEAINQIPNDWLFQLGIEQLHNLLNCQSNHLVNIFRYYFQNDET